LSRSPSPPRLRGEFVEVAYFDGSGTGKLRNKKVRLGPSVEDELKYKLKKGADERRKEHLKLEAIRKMRYRHAGVMLGWWREGAALETARLKAAKEAAEALVSAELAAALRDEETQKKLANALLRMKHRAISMAFYKWRDDAAEVRAADEAARLKAEGEAALAAALRDEETQKKLANALLRMKHRAISMAFYKWRDDAAVSRAHQAEIRERCVLLTAEMCEKDRENAEKERENAERERERAARERMKEAEIQTTRSLSIPNPNSNTVPTYNPRERQSAAEERMKNAILRMKNRALSMAFTKWQHEAAAEREARLAAEEAARLAAEEAARLEAEAQALRDAEAKQLAWEEQARLRAEEEARRRLAEEEERRKRLAEAEARMAREAEIARLKERHTKPPKELNIPKLKPNPRL